MNMNVIDDEIIDEFVVEAGELLINAEEDILDIEGSEDKEAVNRIFRAFHTVKGNAAMIGLDDISNLAHHAEDMLTKIRSGELEPDKQMVDLLLKVVDGLKQMVSDTQTGKTSAVNTAALIAQLTGTGHPAEEEAPPVPEPLAPADLTERTTSREIPPPGKLNILVVEDDFTSRKIIKVLLNAYGNVDVAVNGEEAVEAVNATLSGTGHEPYHLICMDIMMPEMDGMDAVKKIRGIERQLGISPKDESVIIMTTALSDPRTVIKSLYKCGASAYLTKPIKSDMLKSEMEKHGLL